MVRVISYFDTQIRIPVMGEAAHTASIPDRMTFLAVNGMQGRSTFQAHLKQGPTSKPMSSEQMISWYAKILEGVKQRYRKLQRLARFVLYF